MYDFEYRIEKRIARLERTVRQLTGLLLISILCMLGIAITVATRLV